MVLIDPGLLTFILCAGIFGTSFAIGFYRGRTEKDDIIEQTIVYLCENGYLKHENHNGEIEIIKVENEYGDGKTKEED
jgi:hypothetical protein